MSTTKTVTPELRQSLLSESEKLFSDTYAKLGVAKPYHVQKVCYKPKDKIERIIRMFPSELTRGDVYIELVDFEYTPLYTPRRLYKLTHRGDFNTAYESIEGASGMSFIVPFSALNLVVDLGAAIPSTPAPWDTPRLSSSTEAVPSELTFDSEEQEIGDVDAHYNTMTLRDYYCITQNVPLSQKSWLNNLIKEGQKWQQQK